MYGIMSDIHFHDWSQFSTEEDGINSRLKETIEQFERSCDLLRTSGADKVFIAGDVFHVRGSLKPSVMNPVIAAFQRQVDEGLDFYIIPGNHDLETNNTTEIGNALGAISSIRGIGMGVMVANVPLHVGIQSNERVIMFPWEKDLEKLKTSMRDELEKAGRDKCTAIIHAPLNEVIYGIPDHGLVASELEEMGYERVFCGHYHNMTNFNNKVYSIGALTHQTFGDIDTTAGFFGIDGDTLSHCETTAPKFMSFTGKDVHRVKGNYVRVRGAGHLSAKEGTELKEKLMSDYGAKEVLLQIKPKVEVVRGKTTAKHSRIEETIEQWVKDKKLSDAVLIESLDVLAESGAAL